MNKYRVMTTYAYTTPHGVTRDAELIVYLALNKADALEVGEGLAARFPERNYWLEELGWTVA